MRDKVNVLYYPDYATHQATLKKAILFFDEIHFLDRPSFTFRVGFGSIGASSPLRQYEDSFRENGVPLYVHDAPSGPVEGDRIGDVAADLNDPVFMDRFQRGLNESATFRTLHVPPGNYGEWGDQDSVASKVGAVDIVAATKSYTVPMDLFLDTDVRPFDLSSEKGIAKQLLSQAAITSAKLACAMQMNAKLGFAPLADSMPFGNLLSAKFARATAAAASISNKVQMTDLTFSVFDELISPDSLHQISLKEIVAYRKASTAAREEFLDHLGMLQAKQGALPPGVDYAEAVKKIITTEVSPAARKFRNQLKDIDERLIGNAMTGGISGGATFIGSSGLTLFGGMSWEHLVGLAFTTSVLASAYLLKLASDGYLEARKLKRDCALSYVLSLER